MHDLNKNDNIVKPKDLPLYNEAEELQKVDHYLKTPSSNVNKIAEKIKGYEKYKEIIESRKVRLMEILYTSFTHTQNLIEILRAEENVSMKVGAVTSASLLGILLGKRLWKKIFYGGLAATVSNNERETEGEESSLDKCGEELADIMYWGFRFKR